MKDMEGNKVACNNKDIKLPNLIAFIEFRLNRRIKDFGVLAEQSGERWDLNAHLAFKFNKINPLFRKPFSLIFQENKALFPCKMCLLSTGPSLPTPLLVPGTPVRIASPVEPVLTLAQGEVGVCAQPLVCARRLCPYWARTKLPPPLSTIITVIVIFVKEF